ncbi:MAG: YheC/YheD family protein, partial [Candidatus Eisenbacteria bacterium]|nr:YheC/YheD family protein [Candidatus Eisenbacteria bacterium]
MEGAGHLSSLPRRVDLCLAWNWEHDAAVVGVLERGCLDRGVELLQVTPENLDVVVALLESDQLEFSVLFDRASDVDARFLPLVEWARRRGCRQINAHDRAVASRNKASMHLECIAAGLHTPHTIILPSVVEQERVPALDLSAMGDRFCVKPAHGGGGEGVIRHARTLQDVESARNLFPQDRYLVQSWVVPAQLDGRPAWFRVLYCAGDVHPCWWDPGTHIYEPLTDEEQDRHNVGGLRGVAHVIAWACGLDLFSTEIART